MSADRIPLGAGLRVARSAGGSSPSPSPTQTPSRTAGGAVPEPIVRMSSLSTRPTPVSRAATSADFHADSSVWESTLVRASQRAEFADKLDYRHNAFTYGEELSKLTRSHGFKPNVGLNLDGPDSEADFAVLLGNMSHVFGSISRDEFLKLLEEAESSRSKISP
ncbi:hypothetical protein CYMTET_8987 [Cymbomonas tetramitiformis]|uniref:Uncharacterized protein n=1 Tax=Cymbomonas tetramitiformis TaxID=36881 RepID=A0AAE0GS81_9CHLO|nr:hypothetical protein CYMTET_8987 [Cymbomonas tetramitiformis]